MISNNVLSQAIKFEPQKTFVSSNSTRINYLEIGNGENTVIFLHGFGLNNYSWYIFHNNLDNFKLFFFDLKGFGFSDKPKKSDYTINEQSRLILEFIKCEKISKFSIVGHSYGGIVSLSIMNEIIRKREASLNIDKLILIDVPAYKEIKPKFIDILKNNFLSFIALELMPTCFISKHTIKTTFFDYKMAKKIHFKRYDYFFKMKGIDNSMRELANQIVPNNIDEIEEALSLIECPTLVIWGNNDKLIPLEFGYKLNEAIKNSKLKIIDKCGHVPHEEQPNLTKELIINFLTNGL